MTLCQIVVYLCISVPTLDCLPVSRPNLTCLCLALETLLPTIVLHVDPSHQTLTQRPHHGSTRRGSERQSSRRMDNVRPGANTGQREDVSDRSRLGLLEVWIQQILCLQACRAGPTKILCTHTVHHTHVLCGGLDPHIEYLEYYY